MRCGGEDRFIHASHAIKHPSRNLKPASDIGAAPRAAEHNIIGLVDRLMDKNRQAEPWMPPIQKLAKAGPVGVIKLRCTTMFGHTVASAGRRRPSTRPNSHRNGNKALRSKTAPRLGPLLRLCMMTTVRLWSLPDESWGQRHLRHEPSLPGPDHRLGLARTTHGLGGAAAIGSGEDDIGTPHVLLRGAPIRDD